MKKLKAMIFDLDSTLVDVNLNFDLIRHALGIPESRPILEWIEGLENAAEKAQMHKKLIEFELEAARGKTAIDGVYEALEFFQRKGLKMAVLTRNCKEVAHMEIEGLEHFFSPIFSREDHQNCKPGPDGILSASRIWNIPTENIIMMGDYLYDLQAGINAGAKTIWFNNPKHGQRDFSSTSDLSFDCWVELIGNFENKLNQIGLTLK